MQVFWAAFFIAYVLYVFTLTVKPKQGLQLLFLILVFIHECV